MKNLDAGASVIRLETPALRPLLSPPLTEPAQNPFQEYRLELVRTLEAFQSLEAEWNWLLGAANISSLFLSHFWLRELLAALPPEQIRVMLFRRPEDGRLVGVAPLKISRSAQGALGRFLRRVQWIGTEPDVYDWITLPSLPGEDGAMMARQMAHWLLENRRQWDMIDLRFVSDARVLEALGAYFGQAGVFWQMEQSSIMPEIQSLETSSAEGSLLMTKRLQKALKNAKNRLATDYVHSACRLVFLSAPQARRDALEAFCQNHIRYWADRGGRSYFLSHPALKSFYAKMLEDAPTETGALAERLEISQLTLNETQVISSQIGIRRPNGYLTYLASYNQDFQKYRPGLLHFDALLKRAFSANDWMLPVPASKKIFSLGRGDEEYKKLWNVEPVPLWSLIAYRDGMARFRMKADKRLKHWLSQRTRLQNLLKAKGLKLSFRKFRQSRTQSE